MLINWSDLGDALKQLLGYSWRDTNTVSGKPILRRNLPWQHPYSNQLWVKNIVSVKGHQLLGTDYGNPAEGGVGSGEVQNLGPGSIFKLAQLNLHFWRPPYYVRSDKDILDSNGNPQEWLRYVDKNWELSTQMLSREGSCFVWSPGQGLQANPFQGSVGQKLPKFKVRRKWYQLPEQALFTTVSDGTPSGLPYNFAYTQTQTTNPITRYAYPAGHPIAGCVNTPIGVGTVQSAAPWILDNDATKRMFGCYMGTLMYEGVEFVPQPLQLPPALMQIPVFASNEAVAQVQYDAVIHYELFDPPWGPQVPTEFTGHNLMPFSGNGLWYAVESQLGKDGLTTPDYPALLNNPALTPFQYADLSDLFKIL